MAVSCYPTRVSIWREPTLHFVVLGALLFAAYAWMAPDDPLRVVVTDALRDSLARQLRGQTGAEPSVEAVEAAVQAWVDRELLYREALRLGLDAGDPIVRRRLIQKLEFLAEEAPTEALGTAALRTYLRAHADAFRTAARVSFEHVFLRRERAALGEGVLATLRGGGDAKGDAFVHGRSIRRRTQAQVRGLFGGDFADAIAPLPVGGWHGPLPSAYGTHLVRVTERVAGAVPPLESVRGQVEAHLAEARRGAARAALLERLRAEYEVLGASP